MNGLDNAICSVHGKKRTASNLEADGAGGMKCCEGHECNGKGSSKGTPKPGDWSCPICQDLQFARNQECRQCGAPKPPEAGGIQPGFAGFQSIQSFVGGKAGWGGSQTGGGGMSSFEQLRQRMNMMAGKGGGGMAMMSTTGGGQGRGGGGQGGGGWIQPDGTSYASNQPPDESIVCSVHGKKRTSSNLEPDGEGGMKCVDGHECAGGGGQGGGGNAGGGIDPKGGDSRLREGDWTCPLCGDNQFARNKECRKCGTPKGSAWGEDGSFITPSPKGADDPNALFCSVHLKKRTANNMEDDGAGGMRCLRGHECAGGGMAPVGVGGGGVHDPRLFAIAAAAAAAGGGGGGGGVAGTREGDWTCPSCGWMVFARNAECRKCGTSNPSAAGGKGARFSPY